MPKTIRHSGRQPERIPTLDCLRGVAIFLVLWHHSYLLAPDFHLTTGPLWLHIIPAMGFAGVDLFFVLSGFLLFRPYAQAMRTQRPWPDWKRFYQRRALRILPAYYVLLLLLLAALAPSAGYWFPIWAFLLYQLFPAPAALISQINAPLWSLAIEWQFYLLLPWLAFAIAWLTKGRFLRGVLVLVGLQGAGLLLRGLVALVHYGHFASPSWLWPLTSGSDLPGIELFATGMLVAWVITVHSPAWAGPSWRLCLFVLAGAGGTLGTIWALKVQAASLAPLAPVAFPAQGAGWMILGSWLLCLSFACLLASFLSVSNVVLVLLRPLQWLGLISYSVYLWHMPLLFLTLALIPSWQGLYLFFPCLVGGVGCLSYFLIERPFLQWRTGAKRSATRNDGHTAVMEQKAAPLLPLRGPTRDDIAR